MDTFEANGVIPTVFINRKINSDKDVHMLGESLLPEVLLLTSGDYIFQQDNAQIHVSTSALLRCSYAFFAHCVIYYVPMGYKSKHEGITRKFTNIYMHKVQIFWEVFSL